MTTIKTIVTIEIGIVLVGEINIVGCMESPVTMAKTATSRKKGTRTKQRSRNRRVDQLHIARINDSLGQISLVITIIILLVKHVT